MRGSDEHRVTACREREERKKEGLRIGVPRKSNELRVGGQQCGRRRKHPPTPMVKRLFCFGGICEASIHSFIGAGGINRGERERERERRSETSRPGHDPRIFLRC